MLAKICDFGHAVELPMHSQPEVWPMGGTPGWRAPEQAIVANARGSCKRPWEICPYTLTTGVDVWALGCILVVLERASWAIWTHFNSVQFGQTLQWTNVAWQRYLSAQEQYARGEGGGVT